MYAYQYSASTYFANITFCYFVWMCVKMCDLVESTMHALSIF